MAKSAMPKSKAKTAYGLLSEVRKLILEEPKRYDQCGIRRSATEDGAPACGTVCCVGGWVTVLKSPLTDYEHTLRRAEYILGISSLQGDELFDGDAAGGSADLVAHARRGASHIARFQKKYAAQLKAQRV